MIPIFAVEKERERNCNGMYSTVETSIVIPSIEKEESCPQSNRPRGCAPPIAERGLGTGIALGRELMTMMMMMMTSCERWRCR